MDILSFLIGLLPFVGTSIAWFFERKKRKNNFLQDMQNSIDLLTTKYTEILNKWTIAQDENLKLLGGQSAMLAELKEVRKENAELKESMEELKRENALLKNVIDELKYQLDGIKSIRR